MNKTEDKLFENSFYRVLDLKVKKSVKAVKKDFVFDLSHDVQSEEIKNSNKALPKGKYKVIEDKGAIVKIEEVDGTTYSISKQFLDSLIKISKDGSLDKKAKIGNILDVKKALKNQLYDMFKDRRMIVSMNRSAKGYPVIDISYYSSLVTIDKDLVGKSFNRVQIRVFGFDKDGRINGKIRAITLFEDFKNESLGVNRKIKGFRKLNSSPDVVIRDIVKWFKDNESELKKGEFGVHPSLVKKSSKINAAEVTAQSLGEMLSKELDHIFGDRHFFVRVKVKTDKFIPLGHEGSIMVKYASLPKGTKEIVENSLSRTMISIRPFNEDGTLKEHGKIKAEAFLGTFFDKDYKSRNDIKKMRSVKGDPIKVVQSIIKWFKKNKDILLEEREGRI